MKKHFIIMLMQTLLACASLAFGGGGPSFPVQLEKSPACGTGMSSGYNDYACNLTDPSVESVRKAQNVGWKVERITIIVNKSEDGLSKILTFLNSVTTSVRVDLVTGHSGKEYMIVTMSPPY